MSIIYDSVLHRFREQQSAQRIAGGMMNKGSVPTASALNNLTNVQNGDWYRVDDTGIDYYFDGTAWRSVGAQGVTSSQASAIASGIAVSAASAAVASSVHNGSLTIYQDEWELVSEGGSSSWERVTSQIDFSANTSDNMSVVIPPYNSATVTISQTGSALGSFTTLDPEDVVIELPDAGTSVTYQGSVVSSIVRGSNMSMTLGMDGELVIAGTVPPVKYNGANVTSIEPGSNIYMDYNGGVLYISGVSQTPAPTYGGVPVTSFVAGSNVSMSIINGGLSISAGVAYDGSTFTNISAGANVTLTSSGSALVIAATGGGGGGGAGVYVSGTEITSMVTGDNVTFDVTGTTLTISAAGPDGGIDSATASGMISSAIANSTGRGTIVFSQGIVSKGHIDLANAGNSTIVLDPPTSVIASGALVTSVDAANGIQLGVAGGTMTISASGLVDTATASAIASNVAVPLMPEVGSGILTIYQGGVSKGTFNANATDAASIYLDAGGSGGTSTQVTYGGDPVSAIASGANASMSYDQATGTLTIGAVPAGSGILTISQGGTSKGQFSADSPSDVSIALDDVEHLSLAIPEVEDTGQALHVVIERKEQGSWAGVLDTATDYARVRYFSGLEFVAMPQGGIPAVFGGNMCDIDLGQLLDHGDECRLKWTVAGDTDHELDSDWEGFIWPNAPGTVGRGGTTGEPGPQGDPGMAATIAVGSVTTLAAGASATVTNGGTMNSAVFNFGIPQGIQGTAATIQVGSITTLPPGTSATVSNTGTENAAIFEFGIPRGDTGAAIAIKPSAADCVDIGDGYLDANGDLNVLVDPVNRTFDDVGKIQGPPGADAPEVRIQYSADNISYHSVFTDGDSYIRYSTDGGETWDEGKQFIGLGVTPLSDIVTLTGNSVSVEPGKAYVWAPDSVAIISATGGMAGKTGDSVITITAGAEAITAGQNMVLASEIPPGSTVMCAIRWTGTAATLYVLGASSMATISIGTVTKGINPAVTNTGTSTAAVFDFVLPQGDPAPELMLQYSADGTNYHSMFSDYDCYVRCSVDGGATWSQGQRFIGGGVTPLTDITTLSGASATVSPGNAYEWTVMSDSTLNITGGVTGKTGDSIINITLGNAVITAGSGLLIAGSLVQNAINMCAIRWTGLQAALFPLASL